MTAASSSTSSTRGPATLAGPLPCWPAGSPLFARSLYQAAISACQPYPIGGHLSAATSYDTPADALGHWSRFRSVRRLIVGAP